MEEVTLGFRYTLTPYPLQVKSVTPLETFVKSCRLLRLKRGSKATSGTSLKETGRCYDQDLRDGKPCGRKLG